ncbi:MAG TPA: four helix bundle protein [Candidatus Omnitrophota bacterium]|nr:four helix bundle protein [Candidatus Omnitrophota bacterium]
MQDFRKLHIYQKSIDYCSVIYKFSTKLPVHEKYGLISQIKRAASSISLNISEGAGSATKKEFAQFITYSYRSVNEVLTCLELIKKLNLLDEAHELNSLEQDGIELSRMIYRFFVSLGGKTFI